MAFLLVRLHALWWCSFNRFLFILYIRKEFPLFHGNPSLSHLLLSLESIEHQFSDDTMPVHDLYSFDVVIYVKSVSSFQFYGCTTFICCYYYFNTYFCVQFTKWCAFRYAQNLAIDPFTYSHEFIFNDFCAIYLTSALVCFCSYCCYYGHRCCRYCVYFSF